MQGYILTYGLKRANVEWPWGLSRGGTHRATKTTTAPATTTPTTTAWTRLRPYCSKHEDLEPWTARPVPLINSNTTYGVVPKELLTFLGFLGNAEFSPWKKTFAGVFDTSDDFFGLFCFCLEKKLFVLSPFG